MEAQLLLMLVAVLVGVAGFVGSMIWHLQRHTDYDWVERIAYSVFVMALCMLWGAVVGFVVFEQLGLNFGGAK